GEVLVDQRGFGREAAEVGARAKDLVARAGEDHGAHLVIVAGLPHRFHQRGQQLAVERISLGRAVQGDRRHAVLDVVEELVGHRPRSVVDRGLNAKCYVLLPTTGWTDSARSAGPDATGVAV